MAKLFAFESDEVVEGQLEASPEEGEAAAVEAEMAEDGGAEMTETTDAIDEGVEAADQLEEVEEVVEKAEEEGGLDPVAAEAVRIAVEAIASKVGYPAKNIYTLYASESFGSSSSRRANTRLALEGIGEFLKDLWDRIKAAIKGLWEKIVAFWNKHVSTLGRLLKAIESMKDKVSAASSKTRSAKANEDLKCPSSLANIFQTGDYLGLQDVKKIIEEHNSKTDALKTGIVGVYESQTNSINAFDITTTVTNDKEAEDKADDIKKKFVQKFTTACNTFHIGSTDGSTFGVEGKFTKNTDETDTVKLEVEVSNSANKPTKISLSSPSSLKEVLETAKKLVQNLIKLRDDAEKINKARNKFDNEMNKKIDELQKEVKNGKTVDATTTDANRLMSKKFQIGMRAYSQVNSYTAKLMNTHRDLGVKAAKGVLGYCSFCLSYYK